MKKIITLFILMLLPALGLAAGGGAKLDSADIDLSDKESLRKGAKVFINYCLNCHSANHMRFNRMARDLEMDEEEVKTMMYTTDKIGEPMRIAINEKQASEWFGTLPPDLTVIARARGEDWLYTFLRSFFKDERRPFGVNNMTFKDVGMPHVLADLQGVAEPVFVTVTNAEGKQEKVIEKLVLKDKGSLSPAEYDAMVRDLVGFMVYMGEPAKLVRYNLGMWVILFLIVLTILLYLLKKEYWKDVH